MRSSASAPALIGSTMQLGADPGLDRAVVGLGRRLLHLTVGVLVARVDRGRVVLVLVEVPAGDVVGVAVAVVVAAVGEADDDVLAVDEPVPVDVLGVGVVLRVEDAVVDRRRRLRQLARVEEDLVRELLGLVLPVDAALDVGDHRVGVPPVVYLRHASSSDMPAAPVGSEAFGGALRDERVEVVLLGAGGLVAQLTAAALGRARTRGRSGAVWGRPRARRRPSSARRRARSAAAASPADGATATPFSSACPMQELPAPIPRARI